VYSPAGSDRKTLMGSPISLVAVASKTLNLSNTSPLCLRMATTVLLEWRSLKVQKYRAPERDGENGPHTSEVTSWSRLSGLGTSLLPTLRRNCLP